MRKQFGLATVSVDQSMSLAAHDFLSGVVAPRSAVFSVGLDRLAVGDAARPTRLRSIITSVWFIASNNNPNRAMLQTSETLCFLAAGAPKCRRIKHIRSHSKSPAMTMPTAGRLRQQRLNKTPLYIGDVSFIS